MGQSIVGLKEDLRQAIIAGLEAHLKTAEKAANSARDTAISKESIAENKYDTFGLEASYLAHGQSQRVLTLMQEIETYRSLPFKAFSHQDTIDISCFVRLQNPQNQVKSFFIGPTGGGMKLKWKQHDLVIITPETPVGKNLMGKTLGDEVALAPGPDEVTYEIIELV